METSDHYQEWTQAELNNRILQLYEQIQHKTLENLEIAQKNCELEIQIKTIDDILESQPTRESIGTACSNRSDQSLESRYESLVYDHQKLAKRVNQIEELLFEQSKDTSLAAKTLKHSRFKNSSTQLLGKTHRKTASTSKHFQIEGFWNSPKADETTRRARGK